MLIVISFPSSSLRGFVMALAWRAGVDERARRCGTIDRIVVSAGLPGDMLVLGLCIRHDGARKSRYSAAGACTFRLAVLRHRADTAGFADDRAHRDAASTLVHLLEALIIDRVSVR